MTITNTMPNMTITNTMPNMTITNTMPNTQEEKKQIQHQ
jgi:hypothetical protein